MAKNNWRETAKNSLNVRNYKAASKTFRGDPKLAAQYLPLAQTLLGDVICRTELGGMGYGSRIVKLGDGTIIKCIKNSDLYSIQIDATVGPQTIPLGVRLFVEGGWCGLVPIGVAWDPDTYEPIEDVAAGELSIPTPTQGVLDYSSGFGTDRLDGDYLFDWVNFPDLKVDPPRDYVSGMESIALPERLLEWYTDPPPEDVTDSQKALGNKTLWAHWYFYSHPNGEVMELPFRPSAQTGKLKLLFQSVLARDLPTQEIIRAYGQPNLGESGFGLLTSTRYDYYLVRILTGVVSVAPVILSTKYANPIKKYLLAHPNLPKNIHKRLEACLLSTYIGVDTEQEVNLLELSDLIGDTIAYGWHFSWMGRQASLVLHRALIATETFLQLGATHYLLDFTELGDFDRRQPVSETNKPFSCALTIDEEDVVWYPLDTDLIWHPQNDLLHRAGNMEVVGPISSAQWGKMTDESGLSWEGGVNPVYGTTYNAPLYSFYEHSCCTGDGVFSMGADSTLRVLRYQKTILPEVSPATTMLTKLGIALNDCFVGECWPGGSVQSYGEDELLDPERVEGFYITNSDVDQRRDVHCVVDAAKLLLDGELNGQVAYFYYDYIVLQTGCTIKQLYANSQVGGNSHSRLSCNPSVYKKGTGFAIIPYFSSEAVYLGKVQQDKAEDYSFFNEAWFSQIAYLENQSSGERAYNVIYPYLANAACGGGVSNCEYTVSSTRLSSVRQEFTVKLSTAFQDDINIPITEVGKRMEEDEVTAAGGTTPAMTLGTWDACFSKPEEGISYAFLFLTYGGVDTAMFYTADISEAETEDTCLATEGLPQEYDAMFYGYFLGSS